MGDQTAPAEMNTNKVFDAARQFEASISRFAQKAQGNQQSVIALIKQVGEQLRTTGGEAMGTHTVPAEINTDKAHDAARQLQASVSRFAQEGQRESLVTLIKQVGAQLRTTDAKVQDNRAQIDKLASHIGNYRS